MRTAAVTGSAAGDISRGIVRVFASRLGRGPTKARTTISGNLVVVVLEDTLTPAERTLVTRGEVQTVTSVRTRIQNAMKDDMTAVVEGTLGSKVISVLGDHDPELDICVEVFVTDHGTEDGRHAAA